MSQKVNRKIKIPPNNYLLRLYDITDQHCSQSEWCILFENNRAVYTKDNKPRPTIAAAYIRREQPV